MDNMIYIATKLATDKLTDQELVSLYMAATAGFNPKNVNGYEKAASLFTECNGTKMHSSTLEALDKIVSSRV